MKGLSPWKVIALLPVVFADASVAQEPERPSYKEMRRSIEFAEGYGKGVEKATNGDLVFVSAQLTDVHPQKLISVKLSFLPQGAAFAPRRTHEEREKLTARWNASFCNDAFRGKLRSYGIFLAAGVIERAGKISSVSICPSRR